MKFIFSISILIISGVLFFVITNPLYGDIKKVRKEVEVYNTALDNSKELQVRRDELMKNYKSVKKVDMDRLESFLPNTVNNIKFILEVERIANLHGMAIEDIKFDSIKLDETKDNTTGEDSMLIVSDTSESLPYGVFPVEFSTEGKYETFISFLKDLEYNLRLIDVKSVIFTVPEVLDTKAVPGEDRKDPTIYRYTLKVETYWLK